MTIFFFDGTTFFSRKKIFFFNLNIFSQLIIQIIGNVTPYFFFQICQITFFLVFLSTASLLSLEALEKEKSSLNPIELEVGPKNNNFKRQENSSVAATINVETPSIKDLEDSFGGKTSTTTPAPVTEKPTRRTGFYYLVDWNSFLDIDDTKGKRVNLRFQPTIGDPKRFYSVSTP